MKDDKEKDYEEESYWEQVRDFNLSRTPFWISALWQLLETIGPFIIIWILVGADFQNHTSWNHYLQLPGNKEGMLALISVCYLIWAMGIATATFFLKWQKADVFTYTFTLAWIGFAIIMDGTWIYGWEGQTAGVKVITDFVICLFVGLFAMVLGVMITTLARNYQYKIEEEDGAILIAYQNGEEVPTKKQLRLERARIEHERREAEAKEMEVFKQSLDEKIEKQFIEDQKKREALQDMTPEQKKEYKKQQKAEIKKQKMFEKKNKHSDAKEIKGLD